MVLMKMTTTRIKLLRCGHSHYWRSNVDDDDDDVEKRSISCIALNWLSAARYGFPFVQNWPEVKGSDVRCWVVLKYVVAKEKKWTVVDQHAND